MHANLYTQFSNRFPADRGAPFIETDNGRKYLYADLDKESGRYARFLAEVTGLSAGERVAVQIGKSPQALFLYLACLRAGLIYVPLNPAYRQAELDYLLADAAPAAVVCTGANAGMIQEICAMRKIQHVLTLEDDGSGSLADRSHGCRGDFADRAVAESDHAAILYTSGTTGRPKGAMLSHGNLTSNARALQQAWDFRSTDVLLHALPLFHIHGLFVACHCVLMSGARMIFLPKFDAAEVAIRLAGASVFMGVPTYYTRLLAQASFGRAQCANMRLFVSGSAPLLPQTFEEFRERTGMEILERYGMTETGMNTSNPLAGPRLPGTVGLPLPGVSVRIVAENERDLPDGEVGQLLVKGPNVCGGYWRQPEKTAESFTADGFFRTGDLARRDANGYVSIVGRAKDLIISGGLNVYPKEIESYIDALDGVLESAVIGVPHADFGEAVTAVVVRAPGRDDVTEARILAELKDRIANFKVPKHIVFVDELPRNAMGKVQKNLLRERCANETG